MNDECKKQEMCEFIHKEKRCKKREEKTTRKPDNENNEDENQNEERNKSEEKEQKPFLGTNIEVEIIKALKKLLGEEGIENLKRATKPQNAIK